MGKAKKLLFTILSMEGSGGLERILSSRVNYLVETFNYDITIVTTNLEGAVQSFYPLNDKIKVVNIPIDFSKKTLADKLAIFLPTNYKKEKKLLDFINKEKFDICTSFGSETFLYHEKNYHQFAKIKEHRFTYQRMLRFEKKFGIQNLWRKLLFRNSISIQRKMDYIISLTEEDANFWRKYLKRVDVMPNFIDHKQMTQSKLDSKTVIAVGRLEFQKDFESLINAFSIVANEVPDWKLNIFGDGSLRNILQKQIEGLKMGNHIFLKPAVKNIFDQYASSSIYVHTAHYEGFPNTMLEATGHGLPLVAFESVGGVKVLVHDNDNGFLILDRDNKKLAQKIILLTKDQTLRNEMGEKSYQFSKDFSVESIMLKWHQFYSSI